MDARRLASFLRLSLELKGVRRQGWVDRGVEDAESVADHSWSVGLLAWLLSAGRHDLDRERVLLIGIIHDLPEALAGDETPFDRYRDAAGVIDPDLFVGAPSYPDESRDAKRQREAVALEEMLSGLPAERAEDIRSAWSEYDRAESAEARFVKQVDKLETALQAVAYRDAEPEIVIESFLRGAARDISDPELRGLLDAFQQQG